MIIALAGFMGCGKSSIGRIIAGRTDWLFIDLDSRIESSEKKSINEIFAEGGEQAFRKLEEKNLREIIFSDTEEPVILSLGGGTLTSPACAALIHDRTFCIYLKTPVSKLVRNLENDTAGRPMLKCDGNTTVAERIERLMHEREPVYESTAHKILETDGSGFGDTADEIIGIVRKNSVR